MPLVDDHPWAPANETETRMLRALQAEDADEFLDALCSATLAVPVDVRPRSNRESFPWLVLTGAEQHYVPAFTSEEILLAATIPVHPPWRTTTFRELVAAWPDMRYTLLLNPRTPLQRHFAPADLVRLGARPIVDVLDHPGDESTPATGAVMQKFLSVSGAMALLEGNVQVISGYVVALHEIGHFDTLRELVTGLRLPEWNPEISAESEAICAVRWLGVGAPLYRITVGGRNEEQMAAANGWVVDCPPCRGTGFVHEVAPAVQLYHVRAVSLPHGAELIQMTADDLDVLVAALDADRQTWAWDAEFVARMDEQAAVEGA